MTLIQLCKQVYQDLFCVYGMMGYLGFVNQNKFDPINPLIPLSVIPLSGVYCICYWTFFTKNITEKSFSQLCKQVNWDLFCVCSTQQESVIITWLWLHTQNIQLWANNHMMWKFCVSLHFYVTFFRTLSPFPAPGPPPPPCVHLWKVS